MNSDEKIVSCNNHDPSKGQQWTYVSCLEVGVQPLSKTEEEYVTTGRNPGPN